MTAAGSLATATPEHPPPGGRDLLPAPGAPFPHGGERWASGRGPARSPGIPTTTANAVVVTESAWARLKRWHLHAPAERLPLPAVLLTWPAAWIMHAAHVPGHAVAWIAAVVAVLTWLTWARRNRRRPPSPGQDGQEAQLRDRFLPTEAALVAAAWGGWVTAAATFGPTARPYRWPTLIYLAGVAGGYWWLRRHDAVRAARKRRDDLAADLADKKRWHEILPRVGLGGWHVQERRKTLIGEERLITTSPENALANAHRGQQQRDRREARAHPRVAVWPDRPHHHRVARPADHRYPHG